MPGALCLALGAALRWYGPALAERWRTGWADPRQLGAGVASIPSLLAMAAALALVVALVNGGLAWVDADAGRGLDVGSRRSAARGVLTLVVAGLVVVLLAGVCAGAARAVDASEAGLLALWWAWSQRVLFGVGGLLLAAGFVDRALARRRLWWALHRTPDERRRGDA